MAGVFRAGKCCRPSPSSLQPRGEKGHLSILEEGEGNGGVPTLSFSRQAMAVEGACGSPTGGRQRALTSDQGP